MSTIEHMTNAQLELLVADKEIAFEEYQRALDKMLAAIKARVTLPTVNERGLKVTSGCNMQMSNIFFRWELIAQQWSRVCRDVDEARWIKIQEQYHQQRKAIE